MPGSQLAHCASCFALASMSEIGDLRRKVCFAAGFTNDFLADSVNPANVKLEDLLALVYLEAVRTHKLSKRKQRNEDE